MTPEKKFLTTINKNYSSFITSNIMTYAIFNLIRLKDTIKMITLTDFTKLEEITLRKQDQNIWDLFREFSTNKNAINSLYFAIEKNSTINEEFLDKQKSFTPQREVKVETFMGFLNSLDNKETAILGKIATNWINTYHNGVNFFDYYFTNGDNKTEYKAETFYSFYDKLSGTRQFAKILQANPKGLVTCVTEEGYFNIPKDLELTAISKEAMDKTFLTNINANAEKLQEDAGDYKIKKVAQAMKQAKRLDKQKEAEDKRILTAINKCIKLGAITSKVTEGKNGTQSTTYTYGTQKFSSLLDIQDAVTLEEVNTFLDTFNKKTAEESQKTKNEILKLKLDTPKAIKDVVARLNGTLMQKEHIAEIRTKLKTARAKLKTDAEAKAKEIAKAEAEAKAKETATPEAKETAKA